MLDFSLLLLTLPLELYGCQQGKHAQSCGLAQIYTLRRYEQLERVQLLSSDRSNGCSFRVARLAVDVDTGILQQRHELLYNNNSSEGRGSKS